MEFYKEYSSCEEGMPNGGFRVKYASEMLNEDVKRNPQWKSEVLGYTSVEGWVIILVRWVGLSSTEFTEVHYE